MATSNLVTSLQSVVTSLGTLRTQLLFFIAANTTVNTGTDAGPQVNAGNAILVNQAMLMLNAVDTSLQLFNERRFKAGARLDSTQTTS